MHKILHYSLFLHAVALVSDNLSLVLNLILDVSTKWLDLGLQLGVKERELKCIEHDYGRDGAQMCLREMLSTWLKMVNPRPSWEGLLRSLSHPSVGHPALADKIRKEVGIPEQSQDQSSSAVTSEQSGWFPIFYIEMTISKLPFVHAVSYVNSGRQPHQLQAHIGKSNYGRCLTAWYNSLTLVLVTHLIISCLIILAKPKYRWNNEDNFENGYLEVGVGESPIVHFTVESEPPLAEDAQHTLTKCGEAATRRFVVQSNSVKFKKVRLEDSGTYTISCSNNDGLVGEDTIELEVISTGPEPSSKFPIKCSVSYRFLPYII